MNIGKNIAVEPFMVTGNWDSQVKALKAKTDLKFEKAKENDLINRISRSLEKKLKK